MGAAIEPNKPAKGPKPNINVTPLVDVVLVLLIIFMVIIPNMQEGKAIELVTVQNPDKEADQQEPLVVTITDTEVYHYDERDLPRAQILAELARVYQATPKRKILLRADARLRFAPVRSFFKDVQEIGFGGVSLAVAGQREWAEGGE